MGDDIETGRSTSTVGKKGKQTYLNRCHHPLITQLIQNHNPNPNKYSFIMSEKLDLFVENVGD
jgi:hypothetical protein